jgi:hypothetical protein
MKYQHTIFTNKYAEINQTLEIKFSFLKRVKPGVYTNLFAFVKCRDFLGDVICAEFDKKKYSIYGFSYDGKKSKRVQTYTMFALEFPSQEVKQTWIKNWNTYKDSIAKQCKVSLGTIYDQEGNYLIIKASKFWCKSTAALSFYTMILKGMGYELQGDNFFVAVEKTTAIQKTWDGKDIIMPTVEANYISGISNKVFNAFVSNIKKLTTSLQHPSGLTEHKNIGNIHNSTGFYSICRQYTGQVGTRLKQLTA